MSVTETPAPIPYYVPTTSIGAVSFHAHDDCHPAAVTINGSTWVNLGAGLAIFGSLDTLARVAAEMVAAVDALRPPTLDEFLTGAVSDCGEGR